MEKIDDITAGQFLRISELNPDIPTSKRLNVVGKVVGKNDVYIELMTFDFIAGLPFDLKKYEYTILKRAPSGWAEFVKTGVNPNEPNAETATPVKTIKERVFDMVKDNPKKRLSGLLTLAKKNIGGDESLLKANIQLAIKRLRN